MTRALAAWTIVLALAAPARAGVKVDRTIDLAVAGIAGGLWLGSELFLKESLAPSSCRWCDSDGAGKDDLNGFDRGVRDALRWDDASHGTARLFSNLLAYGGVPAIMVGTSYALQRDNALLVDDAILIIQAGVLASLLNQTVKFVAGRDRPEQHFAPRTDWPRISTTRTSASSPATPTSPSPPPPPR